MRILVVTPFAETQWRWFGVDFGSPDYEWTFENTDLFGRKPQHWLITALKLAKKAPKFDVVISHHPYMSLYFALAIKILRVKVKHFAFSFNHGNGRFFKGPLLLIAQWVFPDIAGFVVFSKAERFLYSERYGIPVNKLSFTPWAVNAPKIKGEAPEYILKHKPYACCIGRNNRDFSLFIQVLTESEYNGILVCPAGKIDTSNIPKNIIIKHDLPMDEAVHVMNNAIVNVVPIIDASTGAGHMTIVSSMQLGKPQIVSLFDTVTDYFVDKEHGYYVKAGDVGEMKNALELMFDNSELRNRMAENAKKFAEEWLMEKTSKSFLLNYLAAVKNNTSIPIEPDGWGIDKRKGM